MLQNRTFSPITNDNVVVFTTIKNLKELSRTMTYEAGMKSRQLSHSAGPGVDRLQALQAFNARLVCMTVNESSYDEVVSGVWKVLG